MLLYLRNDLLKSEKSDVEKPAGSAKGEQRGGAYVARAQVGVNSDGSIKYRYFKTEEEYKAFMHGGATKTHSSRGKSKDGPDLDAKMTQEHKESVEKQQRSKHSLLSKDKHVEKSIRLFVRI